jgi:hypothetical protein
MLSKEEKGIFEAFIATEADFAGEPVSWSAGKDPPDVLCETANGRKIGVELGEWLHESQTERVRAYEILERELANEAVKQAFVDWLKQYGVQLYPNQEIYQSKKGPKYRFPTKADRPKFKSELFDLLGEFKERGQPITKQVHLNDFLRFPKLRKFLTGLTVYPVGRAPRGIQFAAKCGSYSPEDARDAFIKVIRGKIAKHNYLTLKKEQTLDELYLMVYYNQALMWNSPYEGVNGGIDVVVEQAREQMNLDHGPFDKVFLFLAFEPGMKLFTLWP